MEANYFYKQGKPIYLLGVNYWPIRHGHLMWEEWDPQEIEKEVAQLKDLGVNVFRAFLLTRDFTPLSGEVDKEALKKFDEFINICKKHSLYVIPSFFVGHMSGVNWDVLWRQGRDFFTHPEVLNHEIKYVQTIAERYKDEDIIMAWLLTNEIPHWTGEISPETARMWTKHMYEALKAVDKNHYVGTGDGARCEMIPRYDGFRVEVIHPYVDFFGPHIYNYYDYLGGDNDELRWSYRHSCRVKYCQMGKPVLLEEFGCSDSFASEEHAADYYRVILHSTLINGACGALGWCYGDFTREEIVPYSYQPQELQYGIVRTDGSEKLAAAEVRRFSKVIAKIDLSSFYLPKAEAAILIPSSMWIDYPFIRLNKLEMYRILEESFTLAKSAHLEIDFLREPEDPSNYKLVFLPNIWMLTALYWRGLYKYIKDGGVIYYSFSAAAGSVRCQIFEELFGCKHELRYGIAEIPKGDRVRIKFVEDFSSIKKGEELEYSVSGIPPATGFCPVKPTNAKVIAVDDEERPAILVNRIGKGMVVFLTYPLEYYLLKIPRVHQTDRTYRLYRAVGRLAGIEPTFDATSSFLELGHFKLTDTDKFILFVINHAWEAVEDTITSKRSFKSIVDFETNELLPSLKVELPPRQVRIFALDSFRI